MSFVQTGLHVNLACKFVLHIGGSHPGYGHDIGVLTWGSKHTSRPFSKPAAGTDVRSTVIVTITSTIASSHLVHTILYCKYYCKHKCR